MPNILGTIGESGPDPPPPPVETAPPHEHTPHNSNYDANSRVDAMSMSSGSLEIDDAELFGDENNQHQGGGGGGVGGNKDGGGVNKGEPAVVDEFFISKETNQLFVARICLSIMLLLTTILISFTIYYVLKQSEESSMQFSYQGDTKQIIDGFVSNLETQLHVLSGISTSLTSYAIMENQTWPYVFNQELTNRGPYLLKTATSGTTHFAIHPMVVSSNNNINEWESFASQNLDWLSSSSDNVKEYIWKFRNRQPVPVEEEEGDGSSYYPMWQNFPIVPEWVNYNVYDDNSQRGAIDTITYAFDAVFSRFDNEPLLQEIQEDDLYTQIVKSENSPIFQLTYPIFNQLRDYSSEKENNTNLVGIITMLLYWELSLEERMGMTELPADMTMVISSPCRFAETYRYHSADGNIEYVSQGDLHDPKFDSYKVGIDIAATVFNDTKTTARPLNPDYCPYTFDMYPTKEYYDTYHTSQPMIFALVVVAVLLFATVLIIYYDHVVESNKKRAIAKHAKQENIVGQLFPKHIRDKLYKGEATGVGDIGSSKSGGGGSSGRGGASGSGTAAAMTTATESKNTAKEIPNIADLDKGIGHGLLLGVAGKNINSMNPTAMSGGGDGDGKDSREVGVLVADEKQSAKSVLKAFGKPIAEHFKKTTVFFFQVVGFDAWSSMRDPGEVFTLLQTLFQTFDMLARKLEVFKVETVGESYVAVTGVPEPQDDHAVRMARFARECLNKFTQLTHELEMELGPDTGDLQCQIGLHSGAVTAGVLKGEKSRFQLFGDTMNTASRMMSTCKPNRIQCSVSTADHIIFAEKDRWLKEREDRVQAKGKGSVQTYWILPRSRPDGSNIGDEEIDDVNDVVEYAVPAIDISAQIHQRQGLIDWHVSLLSSHLRRIAANRANTNKKRKNQKPVDFHFKEGSTAIDEVTEVVALPATNANTLTNTKFGGRNNNKRKVRPEDIELDFAVVAQLRDYVTTIASMYRENAFHNFEHATHVTMSANKLLKRVVSPVEEDEDGGDDGHEYTYGITSNPLTPFALCFCALIHDVDHAGVSNFQLIKEDSPIARLYRHRSVAEQNSVDISWDLLMDDEYDDLRTAIYDSEEELQHFRNMVVNIVLATDIFDKHMKTIRDNRWDKAFSEYSYVADEQEAKEEDGREDRVQPQFHGLSLKATIVMEHLIQASDVAHTMQHWDIYLKWNERLFQEMSSAYDTNRSEKDPATLWYEGEIMFFDKYIIPLAKKLADCGVFGVSSDECLNYALQNRALWAAQGDEIVEKFKVTYRKSNRRRSM